MIDKVAEQLQVTLATLPGKIYRFSGSPDLADWVDMGESFLGTGTTEHLVIALPIVGAKNYFFRAQTSGEADEDEDGLGAFEEYLLGTSDSLRDSDYDDLFDLTEFTNGTNPLQRGDDLDGNGIPDDVEVFWQSIPVSWKQAVIDDSNHAFYDPENTVAVLADLSPLDDYDGDGRSNLFEYQDGTDPADFFNGVTPSLVINLGNHQAAEPGDFLDMPLLVQVENPDGEPYLNAPVLFETNGYSGLSPIRSEPDGGLLDHLSMRTRSLGAMAFYRAPLNTGLYKVSVRLPGGQSAEFDLAAYNPPAADTPEVLNFSSADNGDGTTTYSWSADVSAGQWFELSHYDDNGEYQLSFRALYGSNELPLSSQPGLQDYSVTLANPNGTHDQATPNQEAPSNETGQYTFISYYWNKDTTIDGSESSTHSVVRMVDLIYDHSLGYAEATMKEIDSVSGTYLGRPSSDRHYSSLVLRYQAGDLHPFEAYTTLAHSLSLRSAGHLTI